MKRIGDILTSMLILPILLLVGVGVIGYFAIRFPIWYFENKLRKRR
jgi:hypothetical protein